MSVQPIDPRGVTLREYADFMTPTLEQFGNLGRLDDENAWKEWAAQLLNLPGLSGNIVPNPYQFDDWRNWAMRFNDNLWTVP